MAQRTIRPRPTGTVADCSTQLSRGKVAKLNIYVASSWRNDNQQNVVKALRDWGHEVYDFKNPKPGDLGFHWSEIDPKWKDWDSAGFVGGLSHPIAESGYQSDFQAMQWADACVLVLPSGRSSHLEAGWFIGQGRPILILLPHESVEPELMYKLATGVFVGMHDVLVRLDELQQPVGTE